ncbi:MAG: N-6 DNA methylase [Candidatus Latescibacteria bacterium]|nr:N-6 DNA methylase [Candidatus Latescibacterota bacterium]
MLTGESKRKIDGLRDLLVGKIPVPTEQVKQITLGLIYKFMSDIDEQNKDLGGKSFFTGEYQQYAWRKIMDSSLSAYERLTLYSEGLEKMGFNPNIPQLFRDIFKDAFLPIRDPATVKEFIKGLNEFKYEHSEDLGDAYEYLLSIMGAQGDAGQFRTPRHIIDFIVEAVEPQKTDKVLDPACGTAGFLVSAFKHILANNTVKDSNRPGSALSATEKNNLTHNFVGYDVWPDFVRLSKVNMYLHQFPDPQIYEYDTLTSLDNWNDMFDCILTNPPFMTPKGGIRPHKRFSIRAKKSEVLFVDYIIEHLTPAGKAGIIVPDGILFINHTPYKQLRKSLIENNYIYAIVSLPAGVFNPYSGQKTSILFLDRRFAQNTNDILFLKVENDGFDLGAQRRVIGKTDLPIVLNIIKKFKSALIENKVFKIEEKNKYALFIPKIKILKSDDHNLTADHYRKIKVHLNQKWPIEKVENIIEEVKHTNKIQKSKFLETGRFPIIDQSEKFIAGYWNNEKDVFKISKPVILFGDHTRIFKYIDFDFVLGADGVKILQTDKRFIPMYFYYVVSNLKIKNLGYSRHYKELKDCEIPIPPLEVQKHIVAEIEQYQKVIDGCKEVVKNWRPIIKINPEWKTVRLGVVAVVSAGNSAPQGEEFFINGTFPFYRTFDVGAVHLSDNLINVRDRLNNKGIKGLTLYKKGTILFPKSGASTFLNHRVIIGLDGYVSSHLATINVDEKKINNLFLYYLLIHIDARTLTHDQSYPSLRLSEIENIQIPLPLLKVQNEIVAEIQNEQKAVDNCKLLIAKYEQKIKSKIAEVWGEKE